MFVSINIIKLFVNSICDISYSIFDLGLHFKTDIKLMYRAWYVYNWNVIEHQDLVQLKKNLLLMRYKETCRKLRRPHVRTADFKITRKHEAESDEFRDSREPANPVGRQELQRSATIYLLSSSLGEPSVASDCLKNFHGMYCDFPYLKLLLTPSADEKEKRYIDEQF